MRLAASLSSGIPVLCLALIAQSGCARNPVTGQLQLALISEAQEIQMGQQAAQEVASTIGLVDDPELQQYVSTIGQRLAATSERPELPWSFAVVDDPTPNAFALPGGPIFLTRGLMNLMGSEAQLATVLGHEIGHVTARHHVTRLSRTQLAQIGLGVGGVLFPDLQQLGGLASAGLQLVFLSHGREAERQADDLGFGYALEQNFDVREMGLVFESLQRYGDRQGETGVPSWLLTHPLPQERIESVQERLDQLVIAGGQLRGGIQPYLQQLDGLTYGQNPRHGFFRDGLFLHPDLRFQVGFPAQWPSQNLTQAVMAVSPQQNAAIQLTLADDASPEAAAQRFLSQQGIQVGQTSRQPINGMPAVLARFRGQTQQGVLEGLIGFLAHDGRVYQIMGYAPATDFPSHDRIIQEVIGSFRELTDPAALAVQPNRVTIVRTTETMSLADFSRRFPSVIPIEELVVLNQLPSAETLVPAGSFLKRVVES
ncbi:MAG: M48 family metalloprotease [Gemmatimonadota bacterium]